jgi:uncharacterized protein YdeI (YjbR/CyaY-like superfamily)
MKAEPIVFAKDRDEWRGWLQTHHDQEAGIWLGFYKKGSGQESVSYEQAVEEALCFGWIDSTLKPGDERVYYQRFSPRRSKSAWSEINKRRAARLQRAGRMTPAGLAKINFPLDEIDPDQELPPESDLPEHIAQVLLANPPAWDNLQAMSPSVRRAYRSFLISAKKPETLAKRLERAVELLKDNKRLQDG